ncbi:unnamed protein product [Rhodiola kirilowii]
MDSETMIFITSAFISAYLVWFSILASRLNGPKVWPLFGSLPFLYWNRSRFHEWVADNLRKTPSATYQTTTIALPFLASKQGFYTVTCNPKNIEHILRTRFDNYPKGPTWQTAFHGSLGPRHSQTATARLADPHARTARARVHHSHTPPSHGPLGEPHNQKTKMWKRFSISPSPVKNPSIWQDLLSVLTFDNICGLTFGKDPETLSPEMPENPFAIAFDSATEATLQRLLYPGFFMAVEEAIQFRS